MLIFSLILGGVAFYLIIYKLFVICFGYWRNLCTKHTWAKTLNEYLEALLLLSSLASPTLIGIYRYQHGGLDNWTSTAITLILEIAVGIFCLGLLIIYRTRKLEKDK